MNQKKAGPVTAVVNGVGSRGREAYGRYALKHPDRLKFIAVADPNEGRRKIFQQEHNIPDEMAFESWELMMNSEKGKLADVAFICTPDLLHYEPAIRALELDYDVLLEKPIAPTIEECRHIETLAQQKGRLVQVCHVLRFSSFWNKLKEMVDSGCIGDIVHYDHSENVSYWHFGHSYVRGIFSNTNKSSPLILAKTCHDLDLMYWIFSQKPQTVQSTGSLSFYRSENAPEGAPARCSDGCPHEKTCPWYAPRFYIQAEPFVQIATHHPSRVIRFFARFVLNHSGFVRVMSKVIKPLKNLENWQYWPATMLTSDLSIESKMEALRTTDYGKCIFRSDNDIVDHQISTFTFANGITGTLTVHGVSEHEGREIRIFGTKGVIRGYFRYFGECIEVTDFRNYKTKTVYKAGMSFEGHGGADTGIMNAFTAVMKGEKTPEEAGTTNISGALESHYMGFATEDARKTGKTLELARYRSQ